MWCWWKEKKLFLKKIIYIIYSHPLHITFSYFSTPIPPLHKHSTEKKESLNLFLLSASFHIFAFFLILILIPLLLFLYHIHIEIGSFLCWKCASNKYINLSFERYSLSLSLCIEIHKRHGKNGKSHPLNFPFQSHTQKKCFLLTFSHSTDKNTFIYLSLSLTTLHLLLLKSFFRVRTQEKKSFFLSRFVSFSQHRFNDFYSISIAIAM